MSGGGDPVLKVWDWRAGKRLYDVAIEDTVRPFIAVRRARRQRGYDSDGERKPPSRRWLARQRRREAKAAAGVEGDVGSTPDVEEVEVEDDNDGEAENGSGDEVSDAEATPTREMEDRPSVLVIQKIDTLKVRERVVAVFSAVGCVPCNGDSHYNQADSTLCSVRRRCSGFCCLQTLPRHRKNISLCMHMTWVAPSSRLPRSIRVLTACGCPWTPIGPALAHHQTPPPPTYGYCNSR